MSLLSAIKFNEAGLVPAIAQDADSGRVLMMAWMNAEAVRQTLATGFAHYYSRSRRKQWKKGETSGHVQRVVGIYLDCDGDTLLLKVKQTGPACHTLRASCFHRHLEGDQWRIIEAAEEPAPMRNQQQAKDILHALTQALETRKGASPQESYVASLYAKPDKMLEKIGEEAVESIIAAKNDDREQIIHETADLWFHSLVMLAHKNLSADDVLAELARRFGVSGHLEKASRKK